MKTILQTPSSEASTGEEGQGAAWQGGCSPEELERARPIGADVLKLSEIFSERQLVKTTDDQ